MLPLNGYLHRIKRHATGDCPWHPGVRETQMHFQCKCSEFEPHRTAAHHAIAKAVISALKERTKGWKFYYEMAFADLPWYFKWTDRRQERRQRRRRPDGVAWHEQEGRLIFMEFSRPMDQDDNLSASSLRKGGQYNDAVAAIRRGQQTREGQVRQVKAVSTAPLIFGVRGSVDYADLAEQLRPFALKQPDKVMAAGVRAAITAASTMIDARREALNELQSGQRQHRRQRQAVATARKQQRREGSS